ncbi:uncharacterized protein LOC132184541 isoform X2 [Corylus avellana]|uniref:uncharacterized protein LOC132184541 isoform X2 n=1 Tax=Corylus avellana TaxID=13451 RepID=UPI00286C98F8|nr:uncharacterized protein LOC132184541 isoform X2 [Corylus avellana]
MAMGSQTAFCMFSSSSSSSFGLLLSCSFSKTSLRPSCSSQIPPYAKPTKPHLLRFPRARTRATLDETDQSASTTPFLVQEGKPNREVEESVKVLKQAAKTRKVAAEDILSAFSVIEKAKIEPSGFLDTLGGSKSPGRTWMLIFTAENKLKGGRYFPLTAVQRFDAAAKRIENGVYLGPIGSLTFEAQHIRTTTI